MNYLVKTNKFTTKIITNTPKVIQKPKKIILCGLGNPEPTHAKQRHNIGKMFLNYYANKYLNTKFSTNKKYNFIDHNFVKYKQSISLLLIKPNTFMNISGPIIKEVIKENQIESNQLIVLCDDLETDIGKVKISIDGGDRGHNGLKSIVDSLSGSNNFLKIKIGIGRPNSHDPNIVANWVTGNIPDSQYNTIEANAFPRIEKELEKLFQKRV